jgi:hypothetical protein
VLGQSLSLDQVLCSTPLRIGVWSIEIEIWEGRRDGGLLGNSCPFLFQYIQNLEQKSHLIFNIPFVTKYGGGSDCIDGCLIRKLAEEHLNKRESC